MEYVFMLVVLFAAELIYFRIARKYGIVDVPNGRSSHNQPTLRGGGVIYWLAAAIYFALNPSEETAWIFLGLTAIAAVSFLDDVSEVRQKIRLIFQLLSITCAFIAIGAFGRYPWWAIGLGYFLIVAILNAYNFMDGINGMTGLCSLVILLATICQSNFSVCNPDLIGTDDCVGGFCFQFRRKPNALPATWEVSVFGWWCCCCG